MAITNVYGLSRDIPEPIKREIRQRSGFGCVVCGCSIVDYEHVAPEFARARIHDPSKMTLLCPMCHAKVTRNLLSKARVRTAMENPRCRVLGFSFAELDPANTHPYVVFGGMNLRNCHIPVQVRGFPLFQVEPPEADGGPYRLSASFFDQQGGPSLLIRRNEWRTSSAQWDVEVKGGRITIRSAPRTISLQIAFVPAEGIVIERVDMHVAGYHFLGNKDELNVSMPGGGKGVFTRCMADNGHVGLSLG